MSPPKSPTGYDITVVHTARVFRAAVLRFWLRFCGRDFAIAALGTLVTAWAWAIGWRPWYVAAAGAVCVCFVFGMLSLLVLYLARARRTLREMQSLKVEWSFGEDGFARRTERGEASFAWSGVEKLWRFPDVWLIFLGEESYSTLPRQAMTPLLEAFIERKVTLAGGKVR